jgi:hypothetical protein
MYFGYDYLYEKTAGIPLFPEKFFPPKQKAPTAACRGGS